MSSFNFVFRLNTYLQSCCKPELTEALPPQDFTVFPQRSNGSEKQLIFSPAPGITFLRDALGAKTDGDGLILGARARICRGRVRPGALGASEDPVSPLGGQALLPGRRHCLTRPAGKRGAG